MTNPVWPTTLPRPLADSIAYVPLFDNILKSQMEVGQKKRRRATYVPDVVTLNVVLTRAQYVALDAFYKVTVQEVLPFDWQDFRTGELATYSFQTAPSYTLVAPGANLWQATLKLMTQP